MHRTTLFILLLAFLFQACTENKETTEITENEPDNNEIPIMGKKSFLALGDSYTIGQSVEINERFPVQLVNSLRGAGFDLNDAEIIAQTGWSTGQLINAIEAQNPPNTYDLVTLLIGVNNQYRRLDTAQYRQEFGQLLQQAIQFAKGNNDNVIVLSIPDFSVTPFAANFDTAKIAREIDAFNAINFQETKLTGALYINITGISREALTNSALLAQDGLHPSGLMYAKWVDLMRPKAKEIFQSQSKK